MGVTRKKNKDQSVLAFEGEMTIYTVAHLKEAVFAEHDHLTGKIAFDLQAVTEMDTAGVQLLLCIKKCLTTAASDVKLGKTNELVDAVFSTLDVNSHFAQDH
jgi:anti-sigma B factor antagonist